MSSELKHWQELEESKMSLPDRSAWMGLFREIFTEKRQLIPGAIFLFTAILCGIFEPRVIGWAIDEVLVPHRSEGLLRWVLILAALQCARFLGTFLSGVYFSALGQSVMQRLRVQLFSKLLYQPVSEFQGQPVGRMVTRITNDVSALSELFSAGFISILGNVVFVVGVLANVLWMDLRLGLLVLASFPILAAFTIIFSAELSRKYREARSKLSAVNAFLAENLLGIRVVQAFRREARNNGFYEELNQGYTDSVLQTVKVYAYFQPMITWLSGIALALVLYLGASRVIQGSLPLGVFIALLSYVRGMFQPIRDIADRWNVFLAGMASAERVFKMLETRSEAEQTRIESKFLGRDLHPGVLNLKGAIEFENVSFRYPGQTDWALRNFSASVRPGQSIGVVGPTGAGKSTLIQLLLRFFEPTEGVVKIDGQDIRAFDLHSYRRGMGWVSQDVFLFSGSLLENVSLFDPSIDPAEIERVLHELGWGDRPIQSLILNERGANLSQGERQMIALARALVSHPSIWILDEATANVDSESEKIMDRFFRLYRGKGTAITVAHRLSTVEECDQIWVIKGGRMIESGTDLELRGQDSFYSKLRRFQSIQF